MKETQRVMAIIVGLFAIGYILFVIYWFFVEKYREENGVLFDPLRWEIVFLSSISFALWGIGGIMILNRHGFGRKVIFWGSLYGAMVKAGDIIILGNDNFGMEIKVLELLVLLAITICFSIRPKS